MSHGTLSIDEECDGANDGIVDEIRSALHFAVGSIVQNCVSNGNVPDDSSHEAGNSSSYGTKLGDTSLSIMTRMSPAAIVALTDLTFHYSTTLLSNDLSSFANHAQRKCVRVEDVLLMVRKNASMLEELISKSTAIESNLHECQRRGASMDIAKELNGVKAVRGKKETTTLKVNLKRTNSNYGIKGGKKHAILTTRALLDSSSSEESNSNEEIEENDEIAVQRQRLLKSSSTKFNRHSTARKDNSEDEKQIEEEEELSDFIVDDNHYFRHCSIDDNKYNTDSNSSVEAEFQMDLKKRKPKEHSFKRKSKRDSSKKRKTSFGISVRHDRLQNSSCRSKGKDWIHSDSSCGSENSARKLAANCKPSLNSDDSDSNVVGTSADMAIHLGSD